MFCALRPNCFGFGYIWGFAGVVALVGWKTFSATPTLFAAIAVGLMAAVMYAIAAPYAKRQLSGVSPLVIATISQLSAALFLLPAATIHSPEDDTHIHHYAVSPRPRSILDGIGIHSLLPANSECRFN